MLFNKEDNVAVAIEDVRSFLPIIDKAQRYEYLEADLENAQYELGKIVSDEVVELADQLYLGDDGSGSGDGDGGVEDVDEFLKRVKAAVVVMGYRDFVMNNDVSHEPTGRKSIVDAANQKQAWEFMLERDNEGLTLRMHKAINRLVAYLNKIKITAWTSSVAYREMHFVLLSDIDLFQRYYPIDDSSLLFMKLLPMQRTAQNKHLIPIMGQARFDALREEIRTNGLEDETSVRLLDYAGPVLAYRVMAEGLKLLSVKLLPEGLVKQFSSSTKSMKSSVSVEGREKDLTIAWLEKKVKEYEYDLAEYVRQLAEESGTADDDMLDDALYLDMIERNSEDNKFFSV